MLRLGLIGYGTIGRTVAEAVARGEAGDIRLVAVLDVYPEAPFPPEPNGPAYFRNLEQFLAAGMDTVLEAASQAVLKEVAYAVLAQGHDLVALSVGALVDEDFCQGLMARAKEHGGRVHLPAGAIGGLEALAAAAVAGLDSVVLTTTKPPQALPGVNAGALSAPVCLYEGPAREAVKRFPQNVNVAAAVSLAGIGFDRTLVRVVADPAATRNMHRLEARGPFGELTLELRLLPSPGNPRTSYLAALSAIRLIRRLSEVVRLGA
jgi:aspartate dehydrogenase